MSTSAPEGGLVEVRILGMPLRLYRESAEHHDELKREFAFVMESDASGVDVPARLLRLVAEVTAKFGAFTSEQTAALQRAALEGRDGTIDLVYRVPREARSACVQFDALLDEADRYCEAGKELLTLATPPRTRAFRRWFLWEFVRQIDGEPPRPWSEEAERAAGAPEAFQR